MNCITEFAILYLSIGLCFGLIGTRKERSFSMIATQLFLWLPFLLYVAGRKPADEND